MITPRTPRLVAGVVVALAVAACGSDSPSSTDTGPAEVATVDTLTENSAPRNGAVDTDGEPTGTEPAEEESAGTDSGEAVGTRIVVDWQDREIEVPAEPQRVVSIDITPTMNLALLGISPIAAPRDMADVFDDDFARFVPDGTDLDDYEVLGFPNQLNLEALAALEPDLILAFDENEQAEPGAFDILSAIAPTVFYEFGTNADWRDRFHREAEILGLDDRARELEDEYEAVAGTLDEFADLEFAAVRSEIDGNGLWRFELPEASIPGTVLSDAGMTPFPTPPDLGAANDNGSYIPEISAERLDVLQADLLIVQDLTAFGQDDPVELFDENPFWSALPAVEAGRVVALDPFVFNGGTYASGIETIETVGAALGS